MEKQSTVKLLICYHKPDQLFKDEILTPIHVGRAQAKASGNPNLAWLEENMIGDDTGENISDKNYCYNELTAPYWAWKNYDALGNPDYVGLMHYRRHFIFDRSRDGGVVEYDGMGEHYTESIRYSPENVRNLVDGNDIVYYRGTVPGVYKHYRENHKIEDLDLALEIINRLSPEYTATAQAYVKGDTGCFCNMAIFSRALFFEYCEFLFPILEEFFRLVDMSEKRFFISERLTGIFIAKKIAEGKRALPLASSFIHSEYRIPVVLPFDPARVFETAVLLQSFVKNTNATTHLDFYLLTNGEEQQPQDALEKVVAAREDFKLYYADVGAFCRERGMEALLERSELYPLLLGDLLPKVGKCLYVTQNVLIMKDVEEFFRLCSVDDFWISVAGTQENGGTPAPFGASWVLNLNRLRGHNVCQAVAANAKPDVTVTALLEQICPNQVSVYPTWAWVKADETALLAPKEQRRAILQNNAVWHTMICYNDATAPSRNLQATYSNFWWNIACTVTAPVPFDVDPTEALRKLNEDQKILNTTTVTAPRKEKAPGMVFKAKQYYRQFGFRATVRRFFQKLFRKG
ncbi:MAG: DUF4422 domain-containing protein [Clostridia bacterium]|nr:DUF4422 domain-containing protein [Clostridia bacterium]